jgi:hypothetical protein
VLKGMGYCDVSRGSPLSCWERGIGDKTKTEEEKMAVLQIESVYKK